MEQDLSSNYFVKRWGWPDMGRKRYVNIIIKCFEYS